MNRLDERPLSERIERAIRRVTIGHGSMSVPPQDDDPDLVLAACRDRIAELEAERESRFDCKGGPGTTAPECRGCTTCLNRTIAELEEWKSNAEAGLQALRQQVLDLESQVADLVTSANSTTSGG